MKIIGSLGVDPGQHCAKCTVSVFVTALRGRGVGREVTRLVLAWAFDVPGVHRAELEVLASNSRARQQSNTDQQISFRNC
jgi:RimJ/RimL family protein N-acetyltransferase